MTELIVLGRSGITVGKGKKAVTEARTAPIGGRSDGRRVETTYTPLGAKSKPVDRIRYNQTIKGDHENIIAKGYISSMPRIHQQFEYAVAWQFDFVVAQMIQGPFQDSSATATKLAMNGKGMWYGLLQDAKAQGLSTVSKKQNAASLAYATSHSATLVGETNPGNTSPPSSSSGGGSSSLPTGPIYGGSGTFASGPGQRGTRINGPIPAGQPNVIFSAGVQAALRGLSQERSDQGVDFGPSQDQPIPAVLDGIVTRTTTWGGDFVSNGGPGGVVYKTNYGYVYLMENMTPTVTVGQSVRAGDTIATGQGQIEMGWANSSGSAPLTGWAGDGDTSAGGIGFAVSAGMIPMNTAHVSYPGYS